MTPARLLVVDDDASLASLLATLFEGRGYSVATASSAREAEAAAARDPFDAALVDLNLPDATGLDLLTRLKALRPEASVVMLTASASVEAAVEAMRRGADNFVVKPVDPPALFAHVDKAVEACALRRRAMRLDRLASSPAARILGTGPAVREAVSLAERVAAHDATVLLFGETGSGKGLFARMLHDASGRSRGPFVALNSAGLSPERVESELFGHERGSFTGASERKLGLLEAADGGTLFLDEVGELDLAVQAKLLTALEEKRFRRLGGIVDLASDARLVAATHRDLRAEVAAGRFRADLFHRINVFSIVIPPLRERAEDIVPMAVHFLASFRDVPDAARAISEDAAAILLDYDWPGNARELRNVMERAAILCPPGMPVLPAHLPPLDPGPDALATRGGDPATLEEAERRFFEKALRERKGSLRAAARDLGISRGTLYRKARKYGIPLTDTDRE